MQLIANLAVGGSWPGAPDSSTAFPAYMDIDYIRAWTRADPTAPIPSAAPTGLAIVPGDSQASLSWTPFLGAASYDVKRATTDFGPYTTIASSVTATNYADTGLSNGTTYYYVVSAVTPGGEGADSSQASTTPNAGMVPTRESVADAYVRDGSYLNSNYGTDTGLLVKSDATSYNRDSYLRFDVSGLANATNVKVRLIPISVGATANAATLSFRFVPNNSWTETGITWSNRPASTDVIANITGFQSGVPVDVDITAWVRSQAAADGFFSIRVTSTTYGGDGFVMFGSREQTLAPANRPVLLIVSSGSSSSVPLAPTNLAAMAGNAQVSLSWNTSAGATDYNVKRAAVNGGPYTTIASPTTTAYTDSSVTNGTTYYYVVSATNAGGESANSTQASAVPTAGNAPAVPTGVTALGADSRVSLSWTASSGAASYT